MPLSPPLHFGDQKMIEIWAALESQDDGKVKHFLKILVIVKTAFFLK